MLKRSLLISFFISGLSQAEIINIPKESGFSGSVMAGVSGVDYKSNMFKGPNDDNKHHAGLDNSPDSHHSMIPAYGVDLRYTFASTKTQVFFGNLIQDAIRFDFTQQLGVRQQIADYGIISIAYTFPLLPTKTWEDPYARGGRDETKINSGGGRVSWDHVWGSSFNMSYTGRRFDLQDERSGESLVLSSSEKALLNRNGNTHEVSLSYDWDFSPNHLFQPQVIYTKADLDGRAMSYNKTALQLSYGYNSAYWSIISNMFGGKLNYDETNPIYGKKADANEWGLNGTFLWHHLGSVKGLNGFISAAYSKSDSDINFYNSNVKSLTAGVLYHF